MKDLRSENLFDFTSKSGIYLSLAAIFLSLICVSQASAAIVINEVYGAGGNAGAAYNRDYVELYNNGTTTVDIAGYSLQYASATGTSYSRCDITAADTMIEAGTYFLIQLGTTNAAVGSALPTPDAMPTCNQNISGSNGKLALTTTQTTLNGTTCPPTGATIVDFVGFGTANCSETAAAPAAADSQSSIQRTTGIDTNNNSADFVSGTPTPQAAGATAAGAMINGRVADSRGRGLGRVVVMMSGSGIEEPIYATTNAYGYYRFEDIPAGNTYILTASSIRYTFDKPNIVINVNGNLDGADFIGERSFAGFTELKITKKPK